MPRTRELLAASAVLVVLLTGCTTGDPGPSTTPTTSASSASPAASPSIPIVTPSATPTKSADADGIPTGDALTAWADAALPVDSLGGSAPLLRETAELGPRLDEIEKEIDVPAGTWVLGIACIGAGTVSSDVDVNGQDYQQSEALPCQASTADASLPLRLQVNGPVTIRWEIEADQPAGIVYQVVEGSADN